MVRIDLPEEDLRPEVLRDALAGRVPEIPPSRALELVLELAVPAREQQSLLEEAADNADLEPHLRAGAVRALARVGADAAVPFLRRALESREERLAGTAAAALGQVGGPDDLPPLRELLDRLAEELPRRQASFAEALIVHRFGITGREVDLPTAEPQPAPAAAGALAFVSVRPGRSRRARALAGMRRELPWLDPAGQDVYELQCGPRLLEVVVASELVRPGGWPSLAERPALPAVVAFQDVEHDGFYPGLVVLSRPQGPETVALLATRLSGEPAYVGQGSVAAAEPTFELRSVQRPGVVPVAARVRLTASGVEIAGVSDWRAAPARSPAPMDR